MARRAIFVAPFEGLSEPRLVADLAVLAELRGWDGFFVWDHINNAGAVPGTIATHDPWIALAAIAAATERIRIGPMITPLPRRRPWKVAREAVTLDHLSGGRLILGVGLGFPPEAEFEAFGEETDPRVRAEKLDEALAIITGLWTGEPVSFEGQHYRVRDVRFLPRPVQEPRIPIWVAGMWPTRRPFRRAARFDGAAPIHADLSPLTPAEVADICAYVAAHRDGDAPFDLVIG
jgi:alkanesulfonate monooxygenase SsuD/methylene tetrahydromethanopterin reductase-like flavin-dependent oxidoreductase (luciferase family)